MFSDLSSSLVSIIFLILTPIYKVLHGLIWRITGVQSACAATSTCYGRAVHVQHVLWKRKVSHATSSNTNEFWTTHERFDHPRILLDPSVSLYNITSTEAIFLKTDKDVDIYSSDTHPFMKWAQAVNAEKVYTIPVEAFHRLADETGDPQVPVIWLSSTGRCGSTLLSQVFEKVPGTIAIGEPEALISVTTLSKLETCPEEEVLKLLQSVIRLQCKTLPGAQRIIMKVASFTFAEVKVICEMFPEIKHLFLYRDSLPYAVSAKGLTQSEFLTKLAKVVIDSDLLARFFPGLRQSLYKMFSRVDRYDHDLEDMAVKLCMIGHTMIMTSALMTRYTEFRKSGIPIFAVQYEELVKEKEGMVRALFQKLNVPEKHVLKALAAFEVDSQRGSSISRKSTGTRFPLTPRELSDGNIVLERYGFPRFGEKIDLPGRLQPAVY
ncbi:uncharacterized protein LOC124279214 [Haliotis rubra]|uniref:uncharacterized protein LOC124279214 n=1 Tax=Haliotis rubra TaxID=36100 RepID=UPI001EE54B41|nr:uncharacterized protein LOC124279214 [Haliotis rubra]